jgi:hypothetical protein
MNLPEKTNPPQLNQLVSFSGKMQLAMEGKRINECSTEEVKEVLRYGLMLLGISGDKLGDDLSKAVLINYLFNTFPFVRLDELKLSFDFAVEKRTNPNVTLYAGEFISAKFVSEILTAYLELKKTAKINKIASTPQINMNNSQRFEAVVSLMDDNLKKKLCSVPKEEKKPTERKKLPYYDLHQKWFKQFDQLFLKFGVEGNGRFIDRYGYKMNVEGYFNKKVEQLALSKTRKKF